MQESKALEKSLIQTLRKAKVQNINDAAAIKITHQIAKLLKKNKLIEVSSHYAALATVIEKDASLSLQAARNYQKAKDTENAARWFLVTAERYANAIETSKAVGALRMYSQIKPDDKDNPKRIYNICLANGANNDNTPSIILNDADIAGSKLLASEFFETFDSANFNQLLKSMKYHKFQDGDVINQMGDEATSLYMIVSGAVSGYLVRKDKRTYLGDVQAGDICGETAYFTGRRRTAELIAKGETEAFELPYVLLDNFKQTHPSFNKRIEALYRTRMLVKQLALTPLFENVRAQCREWIAPRMRPMILRAGEVLFKQKDPTLDVYLVRSGKLAVMLSVDGTQQLMKTVETGGIVGETAIIANKQRTASVKAETDTILMKLSGADYETFYQGSKPIREILEKIKKKHILETFDLIKNKKQVEGDDTCEVLLQDIWKN